MASGSQRLAAGTLVPNVTPTATLIVSPTQTTAPVGASIDPSGHLTLSDGASLTGHTIHLLETAPGGVETDIGTASTNIFGAFYFAVPNTLTLAGHWSFRANFDGESTYLPTDATTGVDIGNPPPSLTLGTSAAAILIGGHVTVTATLGAWYSNDQVSIYGTIGTNVNGLAAVIYRHRGTVLIGKTMRVKASWAGDSGNLGGHSKWTSFRLTS